MRDSVASLGVYGVLPEGRQLLSNLFVCLFVYLSKTHLCTSKDVSSARIVIPRIWFVNQMAFVCLWRINLLICLSFICNCVWKTTVILRKNYQTRPFYLTNIIRIHIQNVVSLTRNSCDCLQSESYLCRWQEGCGLSFLQKIMVRDYQAAFFQEVKNVAIP